MSKPKNCVLVVTSNPEWRPQRVHDVPPVLLTTAFYARGLTIPAAIEVARSFNIFRLRAGQWDGQWALMIRALKTHAIGSPNSRQTPRDPASKRSMTVQSGGGI